jgi:hypothetical protein
MIVCIILRFLKSLLTTVHGTYSYEPAFVLLYRNVLLLQETRIGILLLKMVSISIYRPTPVFSPRAYQGRIGICPLCSENGFCF